MESDDSLQTTDGKPLVERSQSTWLDTPEQWVLNRTPVTESDDGFERMDSDILEEARDLGFEYIGLTQRRDYSGVTMKVAHFIDDDGIELRVMAPRVGRRETLWELIAEAREGPTFVMAAPKPYGLVESDEDGGLVVLARRTPLRDGYHYLRRAIAHHLDGVKGMLRREASNVDALKRLERLEKTGASRLARVRRLAYVGGAWLAGAGGAGFALVAVLLIILL